MDIVFCISDCPKSLIAKLLRVKVIPLLHDIDYSSFISNQPKENITHRAKRARTEASTAMANNIEMEVSLEDAKLSGPAPPEAAVSILNNEATAVVNNDGGMVDGNDPADETPATSSRLGCCSFSNSIEVARGYNLVS